MANSYNISRNDYRFATFDEFMFRWDDGTQETSIRVSLHGATKLAEAFKSFGYEQEEDSLTIVKGITGTPHVI